MEKNKLPLSIVTILILTLIFWGSAVPLWDVFGSDESRSWTFGVVVIILVSSGTCLAYKVLQSWVMTLNENDIGCLLNFKWRVYSWQDLTLLPESDALYLYLKTKNGSKITIPIAAFKPSDDVRAFVESRTAH